LTTPALRRLLKDTAMGAMRSAGVYSLTAASARRKNRLLILCYHGIALRDEHEWAGYLFITPDRFRSRLAALRDAKANVLSLSEGTTRLKNGSLPPRSVVLTFDDGFYDFLHHAVPILKEFGFPCTLYWTTYYSGRPFPIINLVLDYLLWKSGRSEVNFPEQGISEPMHTRNWQERHAVMYKLLAWFDATGLDTSGKNEFARGLALRFDIDYDDLLRSRFAQILTPDEAVKVSQAGVDLQLHTHRHRTPDDRDLFLREIHDNSRRIADVSGKVPDQFCYPSGIYHRHFFPWLAECGVQSATTCERGFALPSSELMLLPRVLDDSNMSQLEFEGIVSGLFA
jgi:peptidoglycan/xylan/chitin deacetylase (PgdA/CDA1 family)